MYLCVIMLRLFLFCKIFCRIHLMNASAITEAMTADDGVKPITNDDWLNNIVPNNYDKTISPARFMNDKNSGIRMSVLPISISDISEKNMEFEVELQFKVKWEEPRLPFDEIRKRTSLYLVSPPREFLDRVWSPYLRFTNCKLCEDKRRLADSGIKHLDVWLVINDQVIVLSYRQAFTFPCYFDLQKYPLDSHECDLFIEVIVLGNEKEHVFLKIEQFGDIAASHYVQKYIPAQYKLNDVVLVNQCSDLNPYAINKPDNECIRISFSFHRLIYNKIMLLYLPSTFIVIVSWLSFWMDVEASAPRVALGLTSLLTLSTQFANEQKNLPPVSYVKAIDVWMLTCLFMVFISLVEYLLSYQLKNWRNGANIKSDSVYPVFKKNYLIVRKMKPIAKESRKATTKVDFIARIIFPTSFFIFNIAYWTYYVDRNN